MGLWNLVTKGPWASHKECILKLSIRQGCLYTARVVIEVAPILHLATIIDLSMEVTLTWKSCTDMQLLYFP